MNRSNWEHALIGLAVQLAFGVPLTLIALIKPLPWIGIAGWWTGFVAATALFLGRETMGRQTDIKITTGEPVEDQPILDSLHGWNRDSRNDLLAPAVACFVVALIASAALLLLVR